MTPEHWRQYCLLKRRIEWLELRDSSWCRIFPEKVSDLNNRYADVSMNVEVFSERLAGVQAEAIADRVVVESC